MLINHWTSPLVPPYIFFLLLYVWLFGQYVTCTTFSPSLCAWKRFSSKYFPIELFVNEMNTGSHVTFCLNGCPTPSSSRLWVAARSHIKVTADPQNLAFRKNQRARIVSGASSINAAAKRSFLMYDWKPQWPLTDKKKKKMPNALWPAQVEGGGL